MARSTSVYLNTVILDFLSLLSINNKSEFWVECTLHRSITHTCAACSARTSATLSATEFCHVFCFVTHNKDQRRWETRTKFITAGPKAQVSNLIVKSEKQLKAESLASGLRRVPP